MSDTPNLALPYILAAQSQKHVTHNEAIRRLDALVHLTVLDRNSAVPPASPANGARYIVDSSASGAWAGQAGKIAAFQDGAWMFYTPAEGWIAWVADENIAVVHDGAAWIALASGGGGAGGVTDHGLLTGLADDDHAQYFNAARGDVRYMPIAPATLGINATADTTNRLSVSSVASLFNHAGAGHQAKINKAAAAQTASFLFQNAFSGRAELGLMGDDDFRFKVSADGSTWLEAMIVNRTTGSVAFPNTTFGGGGGGGAAVATNLIVNGDLQINQRAFAGGALAAGVYGFDRWKAAAGGANVSVAGYVVTLASGAITQQIEPALWRYANLASTALTVSVENPSAAMTVTAGGASGTLPAGSGRQSVTLTTSAGSTGNIDVTLARSGAGSITFGRVKVEVGASASAWQARPACHELQLAQRYFRRYGSAYNDPIATGAYQTASIAALFVSFPVPMRTNRSTTVVNPGSYVVLGSGGYSYASAITPLSVLTTGGVLNATPMTAAATGQGTMLLGNLGNGHISFDAEI